MPLQIYLAESPCSLEQLADQVNDQLRRSGRCLVVVSEGFDVGDVGADARRLRAHRVRLQQADGGPDRGELSQRGRPGCQGRRAGNVPGTDQRHSMAYASPVDLDEAYRVGQKAVRAGRHGPERLHGHDPPRSRAASTSVRYDKVPLAEVANSERTFPAAVDRRRAAAT